MLLLESAGGLRVPRARKSPSLSPSPIRMAGALALEASPPAGGPGLTPRCTRSAELPQRCSEPASPYEVSLQAPGTAPHPAADPSPFEAGGPAAWWDQPSDATRPPVGQAQRRRQAANAPPVALPRPGYDASSASETRAPRAPSPASGARAPRAPSPASDRWAPIEPSPASGARAPRRAPSPASGARAPRPPSPASDRWAPTDPSPASGARVPRRAPSPASGARAPRAPSPASDRWAPDPSPASGARAPRAPSPSSGARAPRASASRKSASVDPAPQPEAVEKAAPSRSHPASPATPSVTTPMGRGNNKRHDEGVHYIILCYNMSYSYYSIIYRIIVYYTI